MIIFSIRQSYACKIFASITRTENNMKHLGNIAVLYSYNFLVNRVAFA